MAAALHASSSPSELVVKTHGWTWLDRTWQLFVIAMFPIAVAFIVFLSGRPPTIDLIPRFLGIVVFLACVDLLVEAIISVRQVRITPGGVTFRFIFHSEHRSWKELEPSRDPPRHGGWGLVSRYRNGRPARQRGYPLTIDQARAVLSNPNCPRWELPSSIREGLCVATAPT